MSCYSATLVTLETFRAEISSDNFVGAIEVLGTYAATLEPPRRLEADIELVVPLTATMEECRDGV